MDLDGRVALVTGGARGLGLAVTRRLAEAGASVCVADVAPEAVERVAALPPGLRERVACERADVRDEASVRAAVESAVERFGGLDVLVNNAAIFTGLERRPLETLTASEWDEVLSVNVVGVFNAIKCVVGPMRARGGGSIVNIASNVVFKGIGRLLHYVASKGAVVAMSRAAAAELGPDRIRVNAVAPGYLRHDDFANWSAGRDEKVAGLRSLGGSETPQDVVGAVAFLASDESAFVTGQTIVVDGGEVFH